jgi:hypothetical protein
MNGRLVDMVVTHQVLAANIRYGRAAQEERVKSQNKKKQANDNHQLVRVVTDQALAGSLHKIC